MKQTIKKGKWYSFCCDQDLIQYDVWDSELLNLILIYNNL